MKYICMIAIAGLMSACAYGDNSVVVIWGATPDVVQLPAYK